jgi:hypothetical protein
VAFANYAAYLDALKANIAADWQMSAATAVAATRFGNWTPLFVPAIGAAPTTSVALDKTDARAINREVPNGGAGRLSILAGRINPSGAGGVAVMLVDILNISGGLSGTSTSAQTTNLPTAALTSYTNGIGVQAALVIHTQIGITNRSVTVSYTNTTPTAGRTSPAALIGNTGRFEVGGLIRISLQAGDVGVRSVESVTLDGSTGIAGNFGVMLYRPLALMFVNDVEGANVIDCVSSGRMVGQCEEVLDDACLSVFGVQSTQQAVSGTILLGEA